MRYLVFLAKLRNETQEVEEYIIIKEGNDKDLWRKALDKALEAEDKYSAFMLEELRFLGGGIEAE